MKMCAGTITSSPRPTPAALSATVSAAVSEAIPTQWPTPHADANSASKHATSSPRTNELRPTTRSNAEASSWPSDWCWRSSATNGTAVISSAAAPFVAPRAMVSRPTMATLPAETAPQQ